MQTLIDVTPPEGSGINNGDPEEAAVSGIPSGSNPPDVLTADEAHKVREYLTVILSTLEQLQHQRLDSRGRKQLKRAEAAAQRMAEITSLPLPKALNR